jgi:hypothetical protein
MRNYMDAILFSANPDWVDVNDAIEHLKTHSELYWEVPFPINKNKYESPINIEGYISGDQVKWVATIKNIVPFSPSHYEDEKFAKEIKLQKWINEWKLNLDGTKNKHWKNALVMTRIKACQYDTLKFEKYSGGLVKLPPQGYIRVLQPKIT